MRISIITISFNSEGTIEETIQSVLNQDFIEKEYIIIDGGSEDRTREIISEYRSQIDVFISEPDQGISDAFNKGIRYASGEIIGIINSDDLLCEGTLEKVNRKFENDRRLDVLFGDMILFRRGLNDGYIKKSDPDLEKLQYTFLIGHPATFIRKKAYERYGTYDYRYKCAMDYELISRMYYGGAKFQYIPEVLSAFRDGGISQKQIRQTLQEHKKVALANGGNEAKVNRYVRGVYWKKKLIHVAGRLHVENILRRILKNQRAAREQYYERT